ncbi:MAG: hypothetical protein GXN96_00235 [Aquificae bacterium]|nr:hypothetical protein [Aquificota bacterium]
MRSKLERVSLVIEKYLSDIFGRIRVYREGLNFLIPWGATVINLRLFPEEEEIFLDVNSPVALRVRPTKDLMRFLLSENANIPVLSFFTEFEGGYMDIILGVKIRYRDINLDFLKFILLTLGNLANEYGREIIAVFGGVSFKEYLERKKSEYPFVGEKLFQEKVKVNGHILVIEVFTRGDEYTLVCREEGKSELLIKAKRRTENIYEVLSLLEGVKEALERKKFSQLRKLLNPLEVNFYKLYSLFVKEGKVKKLKELELEINRLPELLINGKISYEEYKRKISEIEKEIGL